MAGDVPYYFIFWLGCMWYFIKNWDWGDIGVCDWANVIRPYKIELFLGYNLH